MKSRSNDLYRLVDLETGRSYPPVPSLKAALDRKRVDKLKFWEIWHEGNVIRDRHSFTF